MTAIIEEDREQKTDAGSTNGNGSTLIKFCRRQQIVPDELQPRKHFDSQKMAELVESFRQYGFDPAVSHLLVRPHGELRVQHDSASAHWFIQRRRPSNGTNATDETNEWQTVGTAESDVAAQEALEESREFKLVFGERRWLAAGEAGINQVPYVEREMSDREVLELQLVENLQRADLNPMEEGEAYRRLIEMGATRQSIAERVGLSSSHVGDRLALCRLTGSEAAAAVARGSISPSHGAVLAKVPSEVLRHELFLKVLNPPDGSPAPWSREALEFHIKMDYVRDLRTGKFDQTDPDLVPVDFNDETKERLWGGACTDCPFNTAVNSQEKRSAKDRSALCTNLECFRAKEAATHERWQTTMAKEGKFVLSPAENAELWDESGTKLAHNSPYVELDGLPNQSELRSDAGLGDIWQNLIGDQYVPVVLGRDTAGKVHELALHELVKKAAHLNGHDIFRDSAKERRADSEPSATASPAPAQTEEQRAEKTMEEKWANEQERLVAAAELQAIVTAAEKAKKLPAKFWYFAVLTLLSAVNEAGLLGPIMQRRALTGDIHNPIRKMSPAQQFGLAVELLVALSADADIEASSHPLWAKLFEVNLKKVRKLVETTGDFQTRKKLSEEATVSSSDTPGAGKSKLVKSAAKTSVKPKKNGRAKK